MLAAFIFCCRSENGVDPALWALANLRDGEDSDQGEKEGVEPLYFPKPKKGDASRSCGKGPDIGSSSDKEVDEEVPDYGDDGMEEDGDGQDQGEPIGQAGEGASSRQALAKKRKCVEVASALIEPATVEIEDSKEDTEREIGALKERLEKAKELEEASKVKIEELTEQMRKLKLSVTQAEEQKAEWGRERAELKSNLKTMAQAKHENLRHVVTDGRIGKLVDGAFQVVFLEEVVPEMTVPIASPDEGVERDGAASQGVTDQRVQE